MNIHQGKRNAVIFGYEFMVFVMTVHIYDLTGSAMNVGLFTALTFLPRLFSPYYGSIADRYPRGRIFSVAAIVSTHSLRDQGTPIEYRGRVYGSIVAILTPAALVSFLAGSYLAGIVGVEKVLIGAGGLAFVSLAVLQMKQGSPVTAPSITTD